MGKIWQKRGKTWCCQRVRGDMFLVKGRGQDLEHRGGEGLGWEATSITPSTSGASSAYFHLPQEVRGKSHSKA